MMSPGTVWVRDPLGPLTVTSSRPMVTSTPDGMVMGALPMRTCGSYQT